jgi:hypothetical protein
MQIKILIEVLIRMDCKNIACHFNYFFAYFVEDNCKKLVRLCRSMELEKLLFEGANYLLGSLHFDQILVQ